MFLTGRDGSQVEAHILGYQFPTGSDNWLLIAMRITTPQGEGASVEPCWQTGEVRRMADWFSAMAEGKSVHGWGGACLEANLEFELVAATTESVTLRASFILASGIWYPKVAEGCPKVIDYQGYIDLTVARSELQGIADEFALKLRQYLPRERERLLPSPLL
jgi:hypothetical protein